MKKNIILTTFCLILTILSYAQCIQYINTDPRFISNGSEISSKAYADQPRIIVCNDGSWLSVMTTSIGIEQIRMNITLLHRKVNKGKTWTNLVNLEAPGIPQSSWAVPLKVPDGRIYVFYNYNKYHFTGLKAVFSGPFCYRFSDDNGNSWSEKRYEVPIRITQIDRDNFSNGEHQLFWSIGKPVVTDEAAYITISKIRGGFYERAEGFILKSENILKETNPEKIAWETLPEGETGIWNPEFGKVQAEHNLTILDNRSLYVVYRSYDGSPAYSISNDGGKTFSTPKYMCYANGQRMGNPRACPKIYKTIDGKYLFWFHNNFGQKTYDGRNPAWLSGGTEVNGNIVWSQPEIVLYARDVGFRGMSYPIILNKTDDYGLRKLKKRGKGT